MGKVKHAGGANQNRGSLRRGGLPSRVSPTPERMCVASFHPDLSTCYDAGRKLFQTAEVARMRIVHVLAGVVIAAVTSDAQALQKANLCGVDLALGQKEVDVIPALEKECFIREFPVRSSIWLLGTKASHDPVATLYFNDGQLAKIEPHGATEQARGRGGVLDSKDAGAQVGRFQVITAPIGTIMRDGHVLRQETVLRIDTATGRTWLLQSFQDDQGGSHFRQYWSEIEF